MSDCLSVHHEPPVPATVHGIFQSPYNPINNSDDVWYCDHCAEVGQMLRLFTPDDAGPEQELADDYERNDHQ